MKCSQHHQRRQMNLHLLKRELPLTIYERSFTSSSGSSTTMDERIIQFLNSQEPEGYLDSSMHHFLRRFTFKEPDVDEPAPSLPGELISLAMIGEPVLDVVTNKKLVVDTWLKDRSKWFWSYTLLHPVGG